MNKQKAIQVLTTANKWRRGDEFTPMPEPKEFGEAIDFAVEYMINNNAKISESDSE